MKYKYVILCSIYILTYIHMYFPVGSEALIDSLIMIFYLFIYSMVWLTKKKGKE